MKSKNIEQWAHKILVKWSLPLTGLLLLLAIAGFYAGSKVQLKLSLTDLLPEDHPAVVKFEKLTEVVGGVGYFAVILKAEDGKSHLEAAPRIVKELKKSDLVRNAFYHRERRFFVDRLLYYSKVSELQELDKNIKRQIRDARRSIIDLGLWDDEEIAKEDKKEAFDTDMKDLARKSAEISKYLTSKDMKHLLVMVKPSFDSTDLDKSTQLIGAVEGALKKTLPPNVTYQFGERYYTKVVETELIRGDIFVLGLLAILLILVNLFVYLRDFRALTVIFLPIAMALGITLGATWLFVGHINIITGFLMGILSGLGVDYAIHLYLRLPLERREPSSDHPDPIWRALGSAGHAVFIGALAAAFAFYLLCFSSFRAFSEFGFVCGTGIVAVFLCLMFSFSTLTRFFKLDTRPLPQLKKSTRFKFPVLSIPKALAAGLVLTLGLVGLGFFVRFEYDFDKMMRHSVVMEELHHLVDDIYERSVTPSAFSAPDRETALAVEDLLKEKYMPKIVDELISGASIIPDNQQEKAVILGNIEKRLKKIKDKFIKKALDVPGAAVRTWLAAKPFAFEDLPLHLQDALRGTKQSGYLLYLYPAISLSNAQGVRTYANMVRDVEKQYPTILSGSDAVVFADILDLINRDGGIVLFAILLFVGLFIWLNVRRWDDTLYSYLPLLISFPVGMGLMVIFGVKFNIFNIAIIPAFVAIGIDVPLHIVHRAREIKSGYKAGRDLAACANLALMTTGIGFGILIFARAGVLQSLGWVALLGAAAIWWVGLLLLPAMLERSYRKQSKKVSESPQPKLETQMATSRTEEPESKTLHLK